MRDESDPSAAASPFAGAPHAPHGVRQVAYYEAPARSTEDAGLDAASTSLPAAADLVDELVAVARIAEQHTRAGFALAERRAYFSARSEFLRSLALIAQALDARDQCDQHARALSDGMCALEEAEDFLVSGSRLPGDIDVDRIAQGHLTPVLRSSAAGETTPLMAQQKYYDFAQQRFVVAVEGQSVASLALHAMGKLAPHLATENSAQALAADAKAMVFQQAALLVDEGNFLAGNELGVLLTRYGRLQQARTVLQHSALVARHATTWHNLAVVHQRLGESQLAQQAQWHAEQAALAARGTPSTAPIAGNLAEVRWLAPQSFTNAPGSPPAYAARSALPSPEPAAAPEKFLPRLTRRLTEPVDAPSWRAGP